MGVHTDAPREWVIFRAKRGQPWRCPDMCGDDILKATQQRARPLLCRCWIRVY